MSKTSAPAPDYKGAAEQTAQSSKEVTNMQTYANRPTQVTPFGSQTWTTKGVVDPATGQKVTQWTQNTQLTPDSQAALDSQLAVTKGRSDIGASMMNRVAAEYGPLMDWNHFSPAGSAVQGGQYFDKKAGDALYNQFSTRNEPIFAKQLADTQTQLRNQGLNPGDEAYDNQIAQLRQQQNDARQNASFQAAQAAQQAGAGMQQQDIAAGGYNTTQRQQQIAEAMQKRGFSLNEINALLNGQQVGMPGMPSFNTATKSDATDYMGAAKAQYSAAQDAANASNATISGIANLAGGAMGMV